VHYHWINSHSKIFNKCVCHNIGAALTKSKFIHFHDCDLLVPNNFYKALIDELNRNQAVQAFNGRRVNYLNEDSTKLYFDGLSINRILEDSRNYREGSPGAPGGSIALSRELFLKVGGFDPHFFWAYSIEDRFFWEKVEKYNHITTLENPKVELYHLWHPPGWGKNPYEGFERRIYQLFSSDAHGWQNYINTSVELYNILVEKFIES
jgi:predicted glycosyltransferase involved in capsule biosynthesis